MFSFRIVKRNDSADIVLSFLGIIIIIIQHYTPDTINLVREGSSEIANGYWVNALVSLQQAGYNRL